MIFIFHIAYQNVSQSCFDSSFLTLFLLIPYIPKGYSTVKFLNFRKDVNGKANSEDSDQTAPLARRRST